MNGKHNRRSTHEYKPTKMLGKTLIGEPNVGHTQSFMSIGRFDTEHEANNCRKYTQTKFFNAMLSVWKVTQNNPKSTFEDVPLQDFTDNSDIDRNASLKEIDQALYRKYSLSDEEVFWIEQHFMRGEKCVTERTKDELFDFVIPENTRQENVNPWELIAGQIALSSIFGSTAYLDYGTKTSNIRSCFSHVWHMTTKNET